MRRRMYSWLILRSLISATKFRLGLVDAEADHQIGDHLGVLRSVSRMMRMARSMSSRIFLRPWSRWSFPLSFSGLN